MAKRILAVLLVLAMVFSMAACGEKKESKKEEGPTATYREDITVVFESPVSTLDRFKAGTETTPAQRVWLVLFDRLIEKEDGKLVPMLATEWKTDDYQEFTFKLRDDVTFHNGEKFKADDVVYTFERGKEAVGTNLYSLFARYIDKVEATSDYEVKITLTTPYVEFLEALTLPYASILNRKACEADPEKGLGVGSGPWALKDFVSSESVTLERNENYWGEKAVSKNLKFVYIKEQATRMLMLETGEAQAIFGASYTADYPTLENDDRYVAYPYVLKNMIYVSFNMTNPITGDINFRKAVASVIDRQKFVNISLNGSGVPYTDGAYWPTSVEFRNNDLPIIPLDVAKAKEYLAQSCYKGEEVTLSASTAQCISDAQVLQEALREIGINATVNKTDGPGLVTLANATNNKSMIVLNLFTWPLGPSSIAGAYLTGSGDNRASYSNKTVDELLAKAQLETNAAEREKIYKEVQRIEAEEIPYIATYARRDVMGAVKGVDGVKFSADGFHRMAGIYMEEAK